VHLVGAINWVHWLCQSIPPCGNTASKNIAIHTQFFHPLPLQQHLVCLRRVSNSDNHLYGSLICMKKPYDSSNAENIVVKTHVLRHGTHHLNVRHSGESACLLRGTKWNFTYKFIAIINQLDAQNFCFTVSQVAFSVDSTINV